LKNVSKERLKRYMFAAKYAHLPQAPLKKNLKEQTLHIMLKKFKEHIP